MDLSLRDLAERSGVSAPMLSQVERGETSPTLSVAERIAAGLELSLSQLLRLDETDGVSVVRASERRRGGGPRHRYEVLTPPLPGLRAEVSLHSLRRRRVHRRAGRPADARAGQPRDRRGRGRAACASSAAGAPTTWRSGDTVTFDADLPHHFENPGPDEASFYAVVAAGLQKQELTECRQASPRSLFDKIWEAHEVAESLLYIDLHLVHEVTSPQAFESLRLAGRPVRRPDRTLATADHNVPTDGSTAAAQIRDQLSRVQVETLERNCARVRRAGLLDRLGAPGHRARDRAGAGSDPAGHDDRLRRLPHVHPRRLRRARLRHRHERGRARARHADAPAAQAEVDAASATRASWATA